MARNVVAALLILQMMVGKLQNVQQAPTVQMELDHRVKHAPQEVPSPLTKSITTSKGPQLLY